MNILMIGHSRSGKTSYMAALYKEFGNNSEGVGITTYDSRKKEQLERLGTNLAQGIYPKGTDIASDYSLYLKIDGKTIIPFNWYDYRGGALLQNSKSSPDVAKLITKISEADALIVFLDGERLATETDSDDFEDEYDNLIWAIQKAISSKKKDTYFPVSFVMTKGDMFEDYSVLFYSEGLNYFKPLIENIKDGSTASGMVCVCEVAKSGIFNILNPLLFSLYYGMPEYIRKRMEYLNSEVEHYNTLWPNLLDDFFGGLSVVFGDGDYKTERAKAAESMKKIQEEQENLQFLSNCQDGMKELLDEWAKNGIIYCF
jgi:hypothetical protein